MSHSRSHKEIADALFEAEQTRTPIAPIGDTDPSFGIADAYAVQMLNVERRLASGRKVIGKKVGLTSKAMQAMLGVETPDYGHLLDNMMFLEDEPVSVGKFIQPRIEAEVAFVLGEDLQGPGVTLVDVLRATEAITTAFEIIDSRIVDWKIGIQDTIADNGSSAGLILGARLWPVSICNLKYIGLVLEKQGVVIDTAAGAAVLGHPANAVVWLANTMGNLGIPLRRGEILLAGSFTKAYPAKAGDVFTAHFGDLGSVKATFDK